MPILKAEVFVLKKHDYGETSNIVNFFSREYGKFNGILKGIRAKPGKFASTLELFSHNKVIFYRSRSSSLHLVSQCDIENNFDHTRTDLDRITAASLITELLDTVMPQEDKNEEVFSLALESFSALNNGVLPDKVVTVFKIKVLTLSGFKPNFDSCISCRTKVSGQAKFSLAKGGLLCQSCYSKDQSARNIYRGSIASILYIEKNNFTTGLGLGMNSLIKKEIDLLLNSFLVFHLEKELKSQKVINKLKSFYKTPGAI
mgnify:CR=1 FL=1